MHGILCLRAKSKIKPKVDGQVICPHYLEPSFSFSTLLPPEKGGKTGISVYGKNERGDHRYDSHGPLGLQPDPDEYASENEPTAQAGT